MNTGKDKVNFRYTNRCHTDMTVIETKIMACILWSKVQNNPRLFEGGFSSTNSLKVSNENNATLF